MDWCICVDPIRCAEYLTKYTAKCEVISTVAEKIIDEVLKTYIIRDALTVTPLTFVKSVFMKLHGLRDYAAYEVAHNNLNIPMVFTSMKFQSVSIFKSNKVNLSKLRQQQQNNKIVTSKVLYKNLTDYYASRLTNEQLTLSKVNFFLFRTYIPCVFFTQTRLQNMNLREFCYYYKVQGSKLIPRNSKDVIISFYPRPSSYRRNRKGQTYWTFARYQLVKYYAWQDHMNTIINAEETSNHYKVN